MIATSFFAASLILVLLLAVTTKYGVPDMVSSIYYMLGRYGWVFQAVLTLFAATMMVCLLDSGLGVQCLAFLACAGLMFVAIAPRFLDSSEHLVHKGCAIMSAVSAVSWCMTVDVPLAIAFTGFYAIYWCCRSPDDKPLFTAEVMALLLVLATYWRNCLV